MYTLSISAAEGRNSAIKMADMGFIVKCESLRNVKTEVHNTAESKNLSFTSNKGSVLITEEKGVLAAMEDSDNDGIYDKVISLSQKNGFSVFPLQAILDLLREIVQKIIELISSFGNISV